MAEEVTLIEGPVYQFVSMLSGSYYVKKEMISGKTLVDGYQNREIIYHRTSYSDSLSGEYETLFEIPFGLEAVSGDVY